MEGGSWILVVSFVGATLDVVPKGFGFVGIGVLALLKYPFYPMFNFDNGMNLISKSLTILTSARLLVIFAFAHIFWRYFVFAGF